MATSRLTTTKKDRTTVLADIRPDRSLTQPEKGRAMKSDRPVFTRRLNGLRVTVWENETDGTVWYSSVFTRHYREGEKWRDVTSFNGLGDLALLAEAVELAKDFIRKKEAEKESLDSKEIEDKTDKAANNEATRPSATAAGKRRSVNNKPSRE